LEHKAKKLSQFTNCSKNCNKVPWRQTQNCRSYK